MHHVSMLVLERNTTLNSAEDYERVLRVPSMDILQARVLAIFFEKFIFYSVFINSNAKLVLHKLCIQYTVYSKD